MRRLRRLFWCVRHMSRSWDEKEVSMVLSDLLERPLPADFELDYRLTHLLDRPTDRP
jgi:hypothetical protein